MANERKLTLPDPKDFPKLVQTVQDNVKLPKSYSLMPWRTKPSAKQIRAVIKVQGSLLPAIYQERYVRPLKTNLHSMLSRASHGYTRQDTREQRRRDVQRTADILLGPMLCQSQSTTVPSRVVNASNCFMAVLSHIYRSLLHNAEDGTLTGQSYPPLMTFSSNYSAPYFVDSTTTKRLWGIEVGVMALPAYYSLCPLLWAASAPFCACEEVITGTPRLISDLKKGMRMFFNVSSLPSDSRFESERSIGLLWQYWAERLAIIVCSVLALGPSYGISFALERASLLHTHAKRHGVKSDTLLRLWSGLPPGLAKSNENENIALPDLDVNPTDILGLHIIIGAIESLEKLEASIRNRYVSYFEELAKVCAGSEQSVRISGAVQLGPDEWIYVNQSFPLELLQTTARRAAAYIATVELSALGGQSLQALVTWNQRDEDVAQCVAGSLLGQSTPTWQMGNDSQWLAGATVALANMPEMYDELNDNLLRALEFSYTKDPYFGWHPQHLSN